MPISEKEYNGYLFDQMSILERIEDALDSGGDEAARKVIDKIKAEINRKLYQQPPLAGDQ